MNDPQERKKLSLEEKPHTVLPNEADPKFSLSKALTAALKAKSMAKKARKPR